MFKNDPKFGMAIGNLTSQIFANFFLSLFDHFMKKFKHIRYGRYVDDFIIIGKSKKYLYKIWKAARDFLYDTYGIKLHPNKCSLQLASKGFIFLGNVIKMDKKYLINRTINAAKKAATDMKLPIKKYVQRLNSYLGFSILTSSYAIRKEIWELIPVERKQYIYGYTHLLKICIKNKYK